MIESRIPVLLSISILTMFGSSVLSVEPPKNPTPSLASEVVEYGTRFPVPGIEGVIILASEGRVPDKVYAGFLDVAGRKSSFIVVLQRVQSRQDPHSAITYFQNQKSGSLTVLDQKGKKLGLHDIEKPVDITGLWITADVSLETLQVNELRALSEELKSILSRGGVIGAAGRNAGWLADFVRVTGNPHTKLAKGLSLFPGIIVSDEFDSADDVRSLFQDHPNQAYEFTLALSPGVALAIHGRRARVVGEGDAIFGLGPSKNRPTRIMRQRSGTTVDLIALSRAAVARAGEEFPAKKMRDPVVESGTLFIGGGGAMPDEGMKRFIEASGGPDALIIVIPTAIGNDQAPQFGEQNAQRIRNYGANNVIVMHTFSPREADSDEFCKPFRNAGGIWFTGGRQWNLVDAYRGTQAHRLMHDVLKRGGAIGGSSAGASIQAEYMVRGHPLRNTIMMAEGYERGLDFLPGVGIDQHFAQRNRFADLASVKHAFPQLICLGIDEQTMMIVKGSIIEVVGPNNLQVYAEPVPDDFDGMEFELVKPGERYDLKLRSKIKNSP